jgi:hypothetical protein
MMTKPAWLQVPLDKRSATIVTDATLGDVRLRSSIKYPR